jgi:lysophospholipase L1-like esterase
MYDFTNVDPVKCCAWLVLPTVYDESLSYGEQLNKFCKALNELIENNNNLPGYVAEMIQNYITSGAIDEVVRNILANYILNVKYPPKGITPAVGDGSADDTDAIQGCIDYAFNQGGGCVYFPYGKYLSRSLTLRSGVSLVGFDRYSTRIVQRGGDTKPLVSGENVQNVQINNLTLDGNNEVQTDELDVVNVLGKDCLFTNLIIKSGYQCLVYNGLGGSLQVDNVDFGGAVRKVAVIMGKDIVQFNNVKFNNLSKVQGECVLDVTSNTGVYNFTSTALSPVCLKCSGSRNTFIFKCENSTINFEDWGENNNYNVLGYEIKEQLASKKSSTISGNSITNIKNNNELDVDGNNSLNIDGTSTVNIGGISTNVFNSDVSLGVKGTYTGNFSSDNIENCETKKIINSNDIILNPVNPITYKSPVSLNEYFDYVPFKDYDGNEYKVLANFKKIIKDDYIAIIGDSFSSNEQDSLDARGGAESWVSMLNKKTLNYSEGGSGYIRTGVTDRHSTFLTQADQLIKDLETKHITKIIIYGGINDLLNKIDNQLILNNAKLLFDKIDKLGIETHLFSLNNGNYLGKYSNFNNSIIELANNYNIIVHNSIQFLYLQKGVFMGDNLHPNKKGEEILFKCINACLNNGEYFVPITFDNKIEPSWQTERITTTINVNMIVYHPCSGIIDGQFELEFPEGAFTIGPNINAAFFVHSGCTEIPYNYNGCTVNYSVKENTKKCIFNPYLITRNSEMCMGFDYSNISETTVNNLKVISVYFNINLNR